jgi:hypothetical protein
MHTAVESVKDTESISRMKKLARGSKRWRFLHEVAA